MKFLRIEYNLDISQILRKIEAKEADPIEILDNFYSFLAEFKRENSERIGND